MSDLRPQFIPYWDAEDIALIDADLRRPQKPQTFTCAQRCHVLHGHHGDPLAETTFRRFVHIIGVSYTREQVTYWRKWADEGLDQ